MQRRFEYIEVGKLGGPSRLIVGKNRDGAALVHRFVTIFSLWDDFIEKSDDLAIHVDNVLQLARGHYKGDDPWLPVWSDFFEDVASVHGRNSDFYCRFIAAILEWGHCLKAESSFSEADVDLDGHLDMRAESVGISVMSVLMEAASMSSFPSELYARPEVQRMLHLLQVITRVMNELNSLPKDIVDGERNLITRTSKVNQMTMKEGIDHFVKLHRSAIVEFDDLAQHLMDEGVLDNGSLEYLEALRHHVFGIDEWHTGARRYKKYIMVDHTERAFYNFEVQVS